MNIARLAASCAVAGAMFCIAGQAAATGWKEPQYFQRIATFPVFLNTDPNNEQQEEDPDDFATVAEIVDASKDGKTLVYTDSALGLLGFVDIENPHLPQPDGFVDVGGEPTSVAVAGPYALVAVNTSEDFVNTSGRLKVVNIHSREIVADLDLEGQPDSVAVSPDEHWAAVAIENERDEELGDGRPPQDPPGFLIVVNLKGHPKHWTTKRVELVGVPDLFPHDPEPEYVDINMFNVAVVTMQENNHVALVSLPKGRVIGDFSTGTVDLDHIDIEDNDLIELNASLTGVPREPDGVAWLGPLGFATADEGDLDGGSRGFSAFNVFGGTRFTSGNSNDWITVRLGHYPEGRSDNKGNEPENVEYARYGLHRFLFVGSERASVIFVYKRRRGADFRLHQVLPAGVGPEGLKAIPGRGLFVAAAEEDAREDKFRSSLTIYALRDRPTYPTLLSANRADGTPIPWGALSALAYGNGRLYSVYDSFYAKSRIFGIDTTQTPPSIDREIVLNDDLGVLAAAQSVPYVEKDEDGNDVDKQVSLADLVNADGTVNLDPEGLTIARDGGFWVASEGSGNLVDGRSNPDNRPFATPNLLLKVAPGGTIEEVVQLPDDLASNQLRFGFEGVASVDEGGVETLYAAFQREWKAAGDPDGLVRIGRYDTSSEEWSFAYYEIEAPTSPNGGWVGNSEIVHLGGEEFAVVERDNQGGPDARIKKLYRFSIAGVTFLAVPDATDPANVIAKGEQTLARDLIADGDLTRLNGAVIEKVEGLAALPGGTAIIVTDNDGVDDSNGETQLLPIPGVF